MTGRKWVWLLLPLGLGLAGVMLLVRVSLIDTALFFPEDLDVLFIVFGLSLAIFAAVGLILRERMEHLRQQSVEQVRQGASAEHRRFVQRLDHELKNPLTALRAGLGTLALTLADENQRQLVQTMEAEARRLSRLVADLRKLAELESAPLDAHLIDLQSFFAEVADLERERIDRDGPHFTLDLAPELGSAPRLIGDQDLLLLAIHNLLDNAFKYTPPEGHVRLRVWIDDEDLVIQVSDTGIGIAEKEIHLVWEELYRGENAKDIPGNGIGLALVKAIVERHYGVTALRSQPGEGTTVTLWLPLA
ncbi:MAG: HAMP domain-containing histidine kinase [Anaerolineae bacterium]|nr:HAMP domain-containing histidine kinase [Anaerolineae bacterium]